MAKTKLKAETREVLGSKVKTLRTSGVLPANIYGKKVKSKSVQVNTEDFKKVFQQVGETGLLSLSIASKGSKKIDDRAVLISNVQVDPVSDLPIHVDFHQVDLKEKVTAQVPVEFLGESPAEKQGLGTVVRQIDEVEVEALPTNLPEKFEVDLSKLTEVDQAILVKDFKYEKAKVEIQTDIESIVVKVEPLRKEEEEVPPAETAEDEETEGEEGEEPKEGEKIGEGEGEEKPKEGEGKEDKPKEDKKKKE